MTAQGHPRTIFQGLSRRHLTVAEATLRAEIRDRPRRPARLTALIAFKQPERLSRVSGRWLLRYLEAVEDATIYDASFMTACLQALGGSHHKHALAALRELAEEATTRGRRRGKA